VVILLAIAVTTTSAKAPVATDQKLAAAADFALPWYSFNGGGSVAGTSPSLGLTQAIGESVAGRGISPDYALDIGFLAGAEVCSCPRQGDIDADGFITALDLGSIIDIMFAGKPDPHDPNCPTTRTDFNCDTYADALDLGKWVDYIFAGGASPCSPCTDL